VFAVEFFEQCAAGDAKPRDRALFIQLPQQSGERRVSVLPTVRCGSSSTRAGQYSPAAWRTTVALSRFSGRNEAPPSRARCGGDAHAWYRPP
jgi:hypothetical protein